MARHTSTNISPFENSPNRTSSSKTSHCDSLRLALKDDADRPYRRRDCRGRSDSLHCSCDNQNHGGGCERGCEGPATEPEHAQIEDRARANVIRYGGEEEEEPSVGQSVLQERLRISMSI